MRVLLKEWSPLLAALFVVLSVLYTSQTLRTTTESLQGRLKALENHIDAIQNAIEGNQGVMVRIATLDGRMGDKLQNLITQRDNALEYNGQELFNIRDMRDEFQAVKNNVDTIVNVTQRIEYLEEMLLDMQASIEEMKKHQNKESQ